MKGRDHPGQLHIDWTAAATPLPAVPAPKESMNTEAVPADSVPAVSPAQPTRGLTGRSAPTPRKSAPISRPRRRSPARLPAPEPLEEAIEKGNFGEDEQGPIRPSREEVRAITEHHAERIIDLLTALKQVETWLASPQCSDAARLYREKDNISGQIGSALTIYKEDFGEHAALHLEAYARHRAEKDREPSR